MEQPRDSNDTQLRQLAQQHGIDLSGPMEIIETGLDFRVALADDGDGRPWVLRVPRRAAVWPKAEREERLLRFVRRRLPVATPEWRICSPELIAYPRLPFATAVSVFPEGGEPAWNIDKNSRAFVESFATALAALHALDVEEAIAAIDDQARSHDPRGRFSEDLERVKREIGIAEAVERPWKVWLDDDASWPDFTVLTHGDLHAGHVLVNADDRAMGIIDWTEAEIGDPATDFKFHLMGFGEEGLDRLIDEYEAAGGRTWPKMRCHVASRLSAFPITYALFALESSDEQHLGEARRQLGVEPNVGA
ncbi:MULTISPECIES: macrolide 2'-phosphotransferase [unclassified Mesorhizobium]|uniref:macrolide 2'-phosphotransferase n=1 Tax=unclassified Mesorhizobium TaxID=325217 RepID=UPI0011288030|nr:MULTISPECIES: macrolide 2'-phosphotransferase [unclassified Mesorhizobium]MBZ9739768.1 macrolide 2'-phosphotransferase [Mesorhizobium sp. CO1-1-4]MBZ9804968.1 macrolide 2'-phosphotransferase [Mesorhizobium sp. ES1-6]TPL88710.1 macrolide 2'-phosphotransferase [Mesorhizobium sp. B2-3-12]